MAYNQSDLGVGQLKWKNKVDATDIRDIIVAELTEEFFSQRL